jgi:hypothetical protein
MGSTNIDRINQNPFAAPISHIAPYPPSPDAPKEEFLDERKQQPRVALGQQSGIPQILSDLSLKAERAGERSEKIQDKLKLAQADLEHVQAAATEGDRQFWLAAMQQNLRAAMEEMGQSDEENEEFLSAVKSAQLAIPEMDPRHNLVDHLYDTVAARTEEAKAAKAAVSSPSELVKLFGEKVQLTNNAVASTTSEWKESVQLVRDLQRFKVLAQEFSDRDKFNYADPSKFTGAEREKVEELNRLHDKLQASGLISWDKKGWDKKDEYQTLKSNLGAAEKIALADREEMQVDLQQLMTSYTNGIMSQASIQKALADTAKFIIRLMSQ